MAASHVGYLREEFNWSIIEPRSGEFRFDYYDELVAQAARHRMHLLPVLLETPGWASTKPANGALPENYPPRRARDFAAFAAACVARYGHKGSFWIENPSLPYVPITAWEIWNEPDLARFWAPRPSVRGYASMLRASYLGIKHVDRGARVVVAGMAFYSPAAIQRYVRALYRQHVHGFFDAFGLHPYSSSVSGAYQRVATLRTLMNRHGDRRKSIWITEFGWAGGPPDPYLVDPVGQVRNVTSFLSRLIRHRRGLGLGLVTYFEWHDEPPQPRVSAWLTHLGLLDRELNPKPVLAPFMRFARAFDR